MKKYSLKFIDPELEKAYTTDIKNYKRVRTFCIIICVWRVVIQTLLAVIGVRKYDNYTIIIKRSVDIFVTLAITFTICKWNSKFNKWAAGLSLFVMCFG
jgi:uncharacterized sodium:solute symporter family permease YidK